MSVLVSDQDRGGDVLARIAPSKTVKLSEYNKLHVDGVWRIADHAQRAAAAPGFSPSRARIITLFLDLVRYLPR